MKTLLLSAILALAASSTLAQSESATDIPRVEVPARALTIEVPANTRFKLEISNTGQSPVEFESTELRREKALAAGSTSAIVFRTLDPGTYQVFDDFHPDAKATLVAK